MNDKTEIRKEVYREIYDLSYELSRKIKSHAEVLVKLTTYLRKKMEGD